MMIRGGMISTIERLDEPDVIIFKHIGMIQDGEEDTESDDVKSWAGALKSTCYLIRMTLLNSM